MEAQMNDEKLSKKNHEGYLDLTAYEAIKNTDEVSYYDKKRFFRLLDTIRYICDIAGFEIEGHVVLKDKETGKVWK